MEMDSVATNFESLTDIIKLDVLKSGDERVITFRVQEDGGTILIRERVLRITSVLDVSCEKTNLGSHINVIISVPLNHGKMLVF